MHGAGVLSIRGAESEILLHLAITRATTRRDVNTFGDIETHGTGVLSIRRARNAILSHLAKTPDATSIRLAHPGSDPKEMRRTREKYDTVEFFEITKCDVNTFGALGIHENTTKAWQSHTPQAREMNCVRKHVPRAGEAPLLKKHAAQGQNCTTHR